MIHLLYAHHPELLALGLAERLAREPAPERQLLHPFEIVVPNRNLKVWLTYELTRRLKAVGHLRFRFLSEFLAGAVTCNPPVPPLMTQDTLMLRLLDLVDRPELHENSLLQPVVHYLFPPNADEREREVRRLQFVETIAGLFLEYEFSRPRMCEAWSRRELTTREPLHRRLETWQAELWRLLRRPHLDADGNELPGLQPLSHRFRGLTAERVKARTPVHLFAFSYMARGYVECLHQLSEFRDVYLYTLNPCREFWEDVETPQEQRRRNGLSVPHLGASILDEPSDDPFGLHVEMENPLLQMWGKPGRENIRFLNEAVDCDFETVYPDDRDHPETLLQRLQEDIYRRLAPTDPAAVVPPVRADGSLKLLTAPSVRREAEVIADEIRRLVFDARESSLPLHFSDIAIIVPPGQKDRYFSHLRAVFQESGDIPHNLPHTPEHRHPLEAAAMIFSLPFGEWRRPDLLRIMQHRAVTSRFPHLDAECVQQWCNECAVFRGRSFADQQNTYIRSDMYNWDQARMRIALGSFMEPGPDDAPHVFETTQARLIPAAVSLEQRPAAAAFLDLMYAFEQLHEDFARGSRLLSEWSDVFLHWFRRFLGPYRDEPNGEQRLREQAEKAILDLGRLEGAQTVRVSPFIAVRMLLTRLEALEGESPRYLSRGVSISSFLPMRPIPFRVIFMAGMSEGRFPSADRRHTLDLRACHRLPGDVSPREQDRYLFLETLLSARDKIYLSYQDRDEITLDPLQPSIVIQELLSVLRTRYLTESDFELLTIRHPLRRDASAYWDDSTSGHLKGCCNSSEAAQEAFCRQVHDSLAHSRPEGNARERLRQAWPSLPESTRAAVVACAGTVGTGKEPREFESAGHPDGGRRSSGSRSDIRLSLTRLRDFLTCPLQGSAQIHLHLGDEADDTAFHEDREPLTAAFLPLRTLCNEVFFRATASKLRGDQPDLNTIWDECARYADLRGDIPADFFGEPVRSKGIVQVEAWLQNLSELDITGTTLTRFISGSSFTATQGVSLPPLELEVPAQPGGERKQVRLTGTIGPLLHTPDRLLLLNLCHSSQPKPEHFLLLHLQHLFLTACGRFTSLPAEYAPLTLGMKSSRSVRIHPGLAQERAREVLGAIMSDLTAGFHEYLYPFPLVETLLHSETSDLTEEVWEERVRSLYAEDSRHAPWFAGRPLRTPTEYPVLPLEAARERRHRWFDEFFQAQRRIS